MKRLYWKRRAGLPHNCAVCCGTCANSVTLKGNNHNKCNGQPIVELIDGKIRVTSTCSGEDHHGQNIYDPSIITTKDVMAARGKRC